MPEPTSQLYQVHQYVRGKHSGMSSWQALGTMKRKRHEPLPRPLLFTHDEAVAECDKLRATGVPVKSVRIVEA